MDIREQDGPSSFQELSTEVTSLVIQAREALFTMDAVFAAKPAGECVALSARARRQEERERAALLTGISALEDRLYSLREAQRCSRLGRIAHQVMVPAQNVQDIAAEVPAEDVSAFKPLFLMAEVELRDAILAVLREDEQLARGVQRQDESLDALYAAEMKRIFTKASEAMFYDFHTGVGLLFILRAIERIGDHAKQLAEPAS